MAVTTDAEGVVDGGDPHGAVMPLTFGLNSAPGQVRSGRPAFNDGGVRWKKAWRSTVDTSE